VNAPITHTTNDAATLRCSRCGEDKAPDEFPAKARNQGKHHNADGSVRTWSSRCTRGRSYVCRECRRDIYQEQRYALAEVVRLRVVVARLEAEVAELRTRCSAQRNLRP
jgi:hypothetical protein